MALNFRAGCSSTSCQRSITARRRSLRRCTRWSATVELRTWRRCYARTWKGRDLAADSNLDRCCRALGIEAQQVSCAGIEGHPKKQMKIARGSQPSFAAFTMAVLGGAMKIEHYEVATYGGLVDKAMFMGEAQHLANCRRTSCRRRRRAGSAHQLEVVWQVLTPA